MPPVDKARIVSLIDERATLVAGGEPPQPHDFQSLRESIIHQELAEEIAQLRHMATSEGDFKELFKAHCRQRAQQNASSSLSFTEMPTGLVNALYWEIATQLFTPSTLGEMLSIILPEVTDLIEYDASVRKESSSTQSSDIEFHFKKQAISTLTEPASLDRLSDFAVSGKTIFDISTLNSFKFPWHRSHYAALAKGYPELASCVYQHNPAFRALAEQISLLQGKGQTPLEAIRTLMRELRLGGSRMTGTEHAAASALDAFAVFMGYLDTLPVDSKNTLMSLSTGLGNSITKVIDDLKRGNCVETAAHDLELIIDNNKSNPVLNTRLTLPKNYLASIVKEYGPKHPLITKAMNSSLSLPATYLKKSFSRIKIRDTYDTASLLLSLPPNLYADFLKYAQVYFSNVLDEDLAQRIKEGFINEEQKKAFFKALIATYQKFDLVSIYDFYKKCGGSDEKLLSLFEDLSPETCLNAVKNKHYESKVTLLHTLAHNPKLLQALLALYPTQAERLVAVKEKDFMAMSVLHHAASYPESLNIILALYEETQRFPAVKEKDNYGRSVLIFAANNPESLRVILTLYPTKEEFIADLEASDQGFYSATSTPESLGIVMSLYNEDKRFALMKNRYLSVSYSTSEPPLVEQPKLLQVILPLLPEGDRFAALKEKNQGNSQTLLQSAASNPELLAIIAALPLPPMDKIKSMVLVAHEKYERWYKGATYRGSNGLFSWAYHHCSSGHERAQELDRDVSGTENMGALISRINEFLTDPKTDYYQHSFASFLLDELNKIQGTPWHGLTSTPSTNCYDKNTLITQLSHVSTII